MRLPFMLTRHTTLLEAWVSLVVDVLEQEGQAILGQTPGNLLSLGPQALAAMVKGGRWPGSSSHGCPVPDVRSAGL
jgi:hypothetical protein